LSESGLHQSNEQFLRQYWVNCIALILNRLRKRISADREYERVNLFAGFPFSSSNQAFRNFFLLSGMQGIDIWHGERTMCLTKGDGDANDSADSG
jgi:hypothetical protein